MISFLNDLYIYYLVNKMGELLSKSFINEKKILDNIFDWVTILDLNCNIKYTNKIGEKVLDLPKNEIINKNCCKLIHESDSHLENCPFKKMLISKRRETSEVFIKHNKRWYLISVNPAFDKYKNIIAAVHIVRDITKQKKAEEEEEVKKREKLFSTIVETIPSMLLLTDKKGKVNYISPNSEKYTGYKPEEFIETVKWWVHPDDRKKAKNLYVEIFKKETSGKNFEYKAIKKNGDIWYASSSWEPIRDRSGKFLGIVLQTIDITEKKKALERVQRLYEMSTDLVCEADINTATFTKINPAFKKVLGYSEKEILGRSFLDFIHPNDKQRTKIIIESNLQKGNNVLSFINRYRCKDGSYRWLEWNLHPVAEEEFTYAIARDITERKKQEQILKKQMMKYNINEGNIYLAFEKTSNQTTKAFEDLLEIGYKGIIFSRDLKKDILKNIKHEFDCIFLSETDIKNSIKPKTKEIIKKIKNQKDKTVIFFDRFDYVLSKNNIKNIIEFIEKTREIAVLKNLILLIALDKDTINKKQLLRIEKETQILEQTNKKRLTKDQQKIIDFVHKQNILGIYPKYKDLEKELKISKPTLRSKIKYLVENDYIIEHKEGRSKNIEVTDKSRTLFL